MRRRFRYDRDLERVVEIFDHNGEPSTTDHRFMPDIRPFVLGDGVEITSRSKLRAYERQHGLKQCGNDWTGSERPAFWDAFQRGELNNGR